MREYLEKKWVADLSEEQAIRLGVATLLEIVESASNIEICVMKGSKITMLEEEDLTTIVAELKKEKEEEEAKKKGPKKD